MLKIKYKFLLLSLLLIMACGEEPHPFSKEIAKFSGSTKMEENKLSRPSSYQECDSGFFSTTTRFTKNFTYQNQMGSMAETPFEGPKSDGFMYKNISLNTEERMACRDIEEKLRGSLGKYTDYKIFQFFDRGAVEGALDTGRIQNIVGDSAFIQISGYQYNLDNSRDYIYNLKIPVLVHCENPWSVKRDRFSKKTPIFNEPTGKCFFIADDYRLTLKDDKEVYISLDGYYRIHPEFPDRMDFVVQSFGFKPVD